MRRCSQKAKEHSIYTNILSLWEKKKLPPFLLLSSSFEACRTSSKHKWTTPLSDCGLLFSFCCGLEMRPWVSILVQTSSGNISTTTQSFNTPATKKTAAGEKTTILLLRVSRTKSFKIMNLVFFKRWMQRRKKFNDISCLEKRTSISTQRQKKVVFVGFCLKMACQ